MKRKYICSNCGKTLKHKKNEDYDSITPCDCVMEGKQVVPVSIEELIKSGLIQEGIMPSMGMMPPMRKDVKEIKITGFSNS